MKKEYLIAGISGLLIIASYLPLLVCTEATFNRLTSEDNVYEDVTAIFYFIAGAILIYLWYILKFRKDPQSVDRRTILFIMLLGLFLIFCCMEEISWGQRLFGIKTPQFLVNENDQREINIHNLYIFSQDDMHHHLKTGISKWVTSARLYALFWIVYCVVVPITNQLLSGLKRFYNWIGLPVISLWLGILFLLNYLVSKIVESFMPPNDIQNITEIKETAFAFLFLLVSLSFLLTYREERQLSFPKLRNR